VVGALVGAFRSPEEARPLKLVGRSASGDRGHDRRCAMFCRVPRGRDRDRHVPV